MREPRYAMGALVFLIPLVAKMMNLTDGPSRGAIEVISAICVSFMLGVILSIQLVDFGARAIYAGQNSRHRYFVYPEIVDRLAPGSTVVNFARRTMNYALFGSTHNNRVIGYVESFRKVGIQTQDWIPEEAPEAAHLKYSALKQMRATHFVTEGEPSLVFDDCVSLQQIERMDSDPNVGKPLARALTVYLVKYCDQAPPAVATTGATLQP
jgi:hypothetical protein